MASKDEYYQKVIATLQSDIKGVQQDLQKLSKRLEALESMSSIHKTESNPSFNHKQFMAELKEWANKHNNAIRDLVVNMFVISWNKAYPDLTTKSQFTQYQEKMMIKITDIEERITSAEKNAGKRISFFTVNRHIQKCDYDGKGCSKLDTFLNTFKMNKYTKWLIMFLIAFVVIITISFMISENNHIKRENALLNRTIELIHREPVSSQH